ncbi:MAG TPA: oligopeptide transporter, OPT family [Polyangiaceae bacterium]|nr:oligopeptide transporter, OPT family [Polyangiaceae bacterium]
MSSETPPTTTSTETNALHPGHAFKPYIPASANLPELTLVPLIAGTLLGVVFGASSLYLVLKVGLTVSASIPVAVISIALFRVLSKFGLRNRTILENNIVQTAGSAGESIAFGIGVTMPAIMILGFDLEIIRVGLVAVLGGLLGILMMIPLRRALIVEQHGVLKYPEGTACAEVLKAGASEESRAAAAASDAGAVEVSGGKTIFTGFGLGLSYKVLMSALKLWKEVPEKVFGAPLKMGSIAAEISPELLGVGYIIGPRIAAVMCAGGVLAYLVLIPAIAFFGGANPQALAPGLVPISQMAPDQIRGAYVLYIGAGAVATGGIVSLVRALPTIWQGLRGSIHDLLGKKSGQPNAHEGLRTDHDLSIKFVGVGLILLLAVITAAPRLNMNFAGALLIVLFGFIFVAVSSRLTGEIGSSSNPISGMTVATLLLTCAFFLLLGWTGSNYYVTALSVGAIVCIAASNGGTTSQDLKTGFLIGATPRSQQIAILVGALASALLLGPILLKLNDAATVYVTPVSFEHVAQTAPLPAARFDALPKYEGEQPQERAEYRLLSLAKAENSLLPGEYLVDPGTHAPVLSIRHTFDADLRADVSRLTQKEKLEGPQATSDSREFFVWQKTDSVKGQPGKYLVAADGQVAYLIDPGINGTHRERPDGSRVTKFNAPKATLISYIIKGILNQQLPWALVLLGVMIAVVLELSGIPSLAFAVGVYLPLSSTTPILVGGMLRGLVDWYLRRKNAARNLSEEENIAEGDKSPGVLLASGYIAGGAIAGIVIAFVAGVLSNTNRELEHWASAHNPFFEGEQSDLLSMIPFLLICFVLWAVGRELWLKPERAPKRV